MALDLLGDCCNYDKLITDHDRIVGVYQNNETITFDLLGTYTYRVLEKEVGFNGGGLYINNTPVSNIVIKCKNNQKANSLANSLRMIRLYRLAIKS
jgi:hypothetical protein